MNIADKLRKVLEIKNNIKAALEEKGIEVSNDFSNYAESIANIKGGGDEPEPEIPSIPEPPVIEIPESQFPKHEDVYAEALASISEVEPWTRPADWIDLEEKIQIHSYEEYPYHVAMLLKDDGNNSIRLGYYMVNNSYRDTTRCNCITVDDGDRGIEYDFIEGEASTVTHDWGGYTGTNGYRWVIYHFDTPDIIFTSIPNTCVQIIFDGVNANVFGRGIYYSSYDATSLSTHSSNIREIVGLNGATIYMKSRLTNPQNYSLPGNNPKLEYITPSLLGNKNISFSGCKSLKLIPEGVDFSGCTSMYYMFNGCSSLTTIPQIDTSACTSFSNMFNDCGSLKTIPEINTSSGTDFRYMFSGCTSLTTIPQIDTSNGTNFSYMFQNCPVLEVIPELNTSSGTNFSYMFSECISLKTIPELNTSNGTNFSNMFYGCGSLVIIPEINTSKGTNFDYIFYSCSSLLKAPNLDLSNYSSSSGGYLFNYCQSLVTIPELNYNNKPLPFSSWFGNCTGIKYLPYIEVDNISILGSLYNLETIIGIKYNGSGSGSLSLSKLERLKYIGRFELSGVTSYSFPKNIEYIEYLDLSSCTSCRNMFKELDKLKAIYEINEPTNVTDCRDMFSGCSSLVTLPSVDFSQCTNFSYMFYNCGSLTTIPEINTSSGTNFSNMFYNCGSLTTIPEINTSSGTNFSNMFYNCGSLTTIPEINTSSGTDFRYMFSGCTSLTTIPQINTSSGTNFSNMFYNCGSLTTIPEINTSSGTNFSNMFYNCGSLTSIPYIDLSNSTNSDGLFHYCYLLEEIKGEELNIGDTTTINTLFTGCSNLRYLPILKFPRATKVDSLINSNNNSYQKTTTNLEFIGGIIAPLATSISFNGYNEDYHNINLEKVGVFDISSHSGTFNILGRSKLTSLKFIGEINCTLSYPNYNINSSQRYRNNIRDFEVELINYNQDFSYWKCLTKQSLLNILNALVEQPEGTTKTLTLNTTYHMGILTDEEKAIAINKGWTLSEYNA